MLVDIGPKKLESLATIKMPGVFNETTIYRIDKKKFLLLVAGVNFSFKIHMTKSTISQFLYDYSQFMTEYDINRIKEAVQ